MRLQLEAINFATHGNATSSDLDKAENLLNSIDTLEHTINEEDLLKLHSELLKFLIPKLSNYTARFYQAYSAEDSTLLHVAIVSIFGILILCQLLAVCYKMCMIFLDSAVCRRKKSSRRFIRNGTS